MQTNLNTGGARRSAPLFILVLVALVGIASAGVVDSLWTRLYNGPDSFAFNQTSDMVVDTLHNRIYVCGSGQSPDYPGQGTKMLIVAYDTAGNYLWARSEGGNLGSWDDMFQAMAVDAAGSVWLVGTCFNIDNQRYEDFAWYKFDMNGHAVLRDSAAPHDTFMGTKSYYTGEDRAFDIVIDKQGKVFVCGTWDTDTSGYSGYTFFVARLNSDTVKIDWRRMFVLDPGADGSKRKGKRPPGRDYHPGFHENYEWEDYEGNAAFSMAAAGDSGVIVAGMGLSNLYYLEGWVMKIRANGTQVWQRTQNRLNNDWGEDVVLDVAVAQDSSIYTCGMFENNNGFGAGVFHVSKLGAAMTSAFPAVVDDDDWATAIALDEGIGSTQNVYVTCLNYDGDEGSVRKYSHTLSSLWALPPYTPLMHPYDITYRNGRVYVTGWGDFYFFDDVKVLCYTDANPPAGQTKDTLWTYTYNGPLAAGEDYGACVVALDSNRIYVAGQVERLGLTGYWNSIYLSRLYYPYRDVALQRLIGLPDTVLFGDSALPQAWVRNYGTGNAVGCSTQLRIALYRDTVALSPIPPGESTLVTFDRWYANGLGAQAVRCTVAMARDTVASNNYIDRSVFVIQHDVTCSLLVSPTGVIDSGTSVTPQAYVKNFGNRAETFDSRLTIGGFYTSTRTANLNPGQSTLLSFDGTVLRNRGSWAVKCSTRLGTDRIPANDAQAGTVRIRVTDGVTAAIISPPDTVNSGSDVQLSARFRNSGTDSVTMRTFFRAEYGTDKDAGLRAQTGAGNVEALMSNDGSVTLNVVKSRGKPDKERRSFGKPQDDKSVDDGGSVILNRVAASSQFLESWKAGVKERRSFGGPQDDGQTGAAKPPVGGVDTVATYDSLDILLAPLAESTVVFGTLYNVQRMGLWQITARCSLAADQIPSNNTVSRTMFVLNRDVACSLLVAPAGTVDSGASVTPQAWVRNYGSQAETFNTRLTVGGFYTSTKNVTVGVGAAQLVSFDATVLRARGSWAVRCTTMLANDRWAANDLATGTVYIRVTDAATVAIVSPPDTLYFGDNAVLTARFGNRGTDAAMVRCWFRAGYGGDTVAYFDSLDLILSPLSESLVTFTTLTHVQRMGLWSISAWCVVTGDQVAGNNAISQTMFVLPPGGVAWPSGWVEADSVPRGGGKDVKAGGALAVMDEGLTSTIYALKGNKTNEFYKYNMLRDSWTGMPPVDPGVSGKLPYTGARLCADNQQHIYMLKGNNTFEFWRFNTASQIWERKDDVPFGLRKQKIKGGDDMAYVDRNDSGYVYLLKGYRNEFYRFNVLRDTWETLDSAPIGANAKYNKGSYLVNDGERYLYAVKAKYGELWRFDTDINKWDYTANLAPMPLYNSQGRRKKPGDGGNGGWYNNGFYALKGGNTPEFWRYDALRDTWTEKETLKSVGHTGRKKLVKTGGALVNSRYAMWALKGNKTTEFWRYGIPLGLVYGDRPSRDGVAANSTIDNHSSQFVVAPNPMSGRGELRYSVAEPVELTVQVHDAVGRLVATPIVSRAVSGKGALPLDVHGLSGGIYLLRISAGGSQPVRTLKLVVR